MCWWLVKEHCKLWHTPCQAPYATYKDANYAIESTAFKRVIHKLHFDATRKASSENAVKDATLHLAAVAIHEGEEHQTYRRVARLGDQLFIDLCDETWDCVQIDRKWLENRQKPGQFVRSENAAPLPRPVPGGDLQVLRKFVNLGDGDFKLFTGSLLDALKGYGPYFVIRAHRTKACQNQPCAGSQSGSSTPHAKPNWPQPQKTWSEAGHRRCQLAFAGLRQPIQASAYHVRCLLQVGDRRWFPELGLFTNGEQFVSCADARSGSTASKTLPPS